MRIHHNEWRQKLENGSLHTLWLIHRLFYLAMLFQANKFIHLDNFNVEVSAHGQLGNISDRPGWRAPAILPGRRSGYLKAYYWFLKTAKIYRVPERDWNSRFQRFTSLLSVTTNYHTAVFTKTLNILVRDTAGPATWQWQFLLCQCIKLRIPKTVSDEILQKKKKVKSNKKDCRWTERLGGADWKKIQRNNERIKKNGYS
jgi:hypothetical protein